MKLERYIKQYELYSKQKAGALCTDLKSFVINLKKSKLFKIVIVVRDKWDDVSQKPVILFHLMGIGELLWKLEKRFYRLLTDKDHSNFRKYFVNWKYHREAYYILRNYICHEPWESLNFIAGSSNTSKPLFWIYDNGEKPFGFSYEETFLYCMKIENLKEVEQWTHLNLRD
jgi:hypothetical protein